VLAGPREVESLPDCELLSELPEPLVPEPLMPELLLSELLPPALEPAALPAPPVAPPPPWPGPTRPDSSGAGVVPGVCAPGPAPWEVSLLEDCALAMPTAATAATAANKVFNDWLIPISCAFR
jgi:hypothetical protein